MLGGRSIGGMESGNDDETQPANAGGYGSSKDTPVRSVPERDFGYSDGGFDGDDIPF